jgi:hypothetical protein
MELTKKYQAPRVDSPERSQHSHDSPCHGPDSVAPCCSAGFGSHSSAATSASSAQGCLGVPLRTGISIMPNLSTFKAIVARGGCELHWASWAYQLESSDGAAGM